MDFMVNSRSRFVNLLLHSVKLKFRGMFTMLSEKVHGVKSKTVKIMKSHCVLTYVYDVKLCCYAI